MKRVIALIRTSTDRQDREAQKKEVIETIISDGYGIEEIEVVGDEEGASAIKVDEQYMKNLNKVYDLIDSGSIESVYAWAIDRIGRTRIHLTQFRERLLEKKVQLVIKNPSLRLLNEDGSENGGVALAFALFIEMAVQEMEQKKARFSRGKKRNAEAGKFNGGIVPYGYELDENGFFVPKKEEADVVKLAFELMASDNYTTSALTEELRSRGIMYNGRLITYQFVVAILKNTSYIGFRKKYAFNKKYPRLVSDELFYKVKEVMANNNSSKGKAKKHYNFASLLIKCPVCGRSYIVHNNKYVCSSHNSPTIRRNMGQKECDNNLMIHSEHLDGLLWSIATAKHYKYIAGLDKEKKAEIEEQIRLIELKKQESPKLLKDIAERFERVEDVYMDGRMSGDKYKKKIAQIKADEDRIKNEIMQYDEEINRLKLLLNSHGSKNPFFKYFENNFAITELKAEENEKTMYDIVHRYITEVKLDRTTLPTNLTLTVYNGVQTKTTYDLGGRKAVKITVYTLGSTLKDAGFIYNGDENTMTFYYIPNLKHIENKIIYITDKRKEVRLFDYEKIIRGEDGYATTESIRRSKELVEAFSDVLRADYSNREEIYNTLVTDILPKYGDSYTGDFDEVGEELFREVKIAYNRLHRLRSKFWATINTLNTVAKQFNIEGTQDKLLAKVIQHLGNLIRQKRKVGD